MPGSEALPQHRVVEEGCDVQDSVFSSSQLGLLSMVKRRDAEEEKNAWICRSDVVPIFWWSDTSCSALFAEGHHGGGDGVENIWSIWSARIGSGSFSSAQKPELRRLLNNGGRWAVSLATPVTLLVERRPLQAVAHDCARLPSSSRRDVLGEAVLHWCTAHSFLLWRRLESAGWRSNGVKWFVPGGDWTASVLRWQHGPDCVFRSRHGVLLASSRDQFVISFLVSPLLRFVLSLDF